MAQTDIEIFEIFPWNMNFETGIALIDEQHRQLVHILNQLAAHLGNHATPVELNQVFAELAAYADYHFKTEESIWRPYFKDDSAFISHQRTHHSFMAKVAELKAEEKSKPLDEVVGGILKFLTHWLAYHILDNDKRMAKTLQAIDGGLPMEQAKQRADHEMSGSMKVLIETVLAMYDHLSARTLELMREQNERKKIQKTLEKSEQREKAFSDTVMHSVPGLLYLFDEQLHLVRWNNRFIELSGYSPEELRSMKLLDFFDEKYHKDILDNVESFYHGGYREVEGRLLARDGTSHPFLFTSVPLCIDGKNYFVGNGVDISRRKQAEKRLHMLSSSIEQTKESILITDRSGIIRYINPAFTALTGYAEDEIVGKNPSMLNSGKQNNSFYQEMCQAIGSGTAWQGRIVANKKDGSFYPAMLTISPVKNKAGAIEHYVGIQQDLSAYEDLEMQFHQAQKIEAIGTLVGGIAHDFNNMLAGIMGNVYLAKRRALGMPDIIQKLTGIEQSSFRAADMIQQLLTFARKDAVSVRNLPFTPLIKETVKFLRTSVPENIEFRQSICTDSLPVLGDSTQIHQVLMNLVNNARDAVADVDRPRIAIALEPWSPNEAFMQAHPYFKACSYAHLSVADNGCGIRGEDLKHVFEPFFTTKEQGKGTGLGLAMVFGAVKTHHGFVEVESSPGEGSTFHVYIPLLESKDHAFDPAAQKEAIVEGKGECILFVDDDPQIVNMGKEILESLGYRVITACNGQDAVDSFSAHEQDIVLVITDVVMPVLSGVKCIEKIRVINPDIKVIYSSGYGRDAGSPHAVPPGSTVLSKPYNMVELSKMIHHTLNGGI